MDIMKWFKGTVTGEQALKGEGIKDINALILMAKKEVFDDIETQLYFRDMSAINKKIIYRLKKQHLSKTQSTSKSNSKDSTGDNST